MANHFSIYLIQDECLDYLAKNPKQIANFVDGTSPDTSDGPDQWPTTPQLPIEMGVNHRNPHLYHRLLNGTPDAVKGAGSIFQTWLIPEHDAVEIISWELFGFHSSEASELQTLISELDEYLLAERYENWLDSESKSIPVTIGQGGAILRTFRKLAKTIQDNAPTGLIWIST